MSEKQELSIPQHEAPNSDDLPEGWLRVGSLDMDAQGIARRPDGKVVYVTLQGSGTVAAAAPLLVLIGFAFYGVGVILFLAVLTLLIARMALRDPLPAPLAACTEALPPTDLAMREGRPGSASVAPRERRIKRRRFMGYSGVW